MRYMKEKKRNDGYEQATCIGCLRLKLHGNGAEMRDHSHNLSYATTFQVEPENRRDGVPFLEFYPSLPQMSQQSRNEKDHAPMHAPMEPQRLECSLWSLVQYECDLSPASIVCKPIYRLMKKYE